QSSPKPVDSLRQWTAREKNADTMDLCLPRVGKRSSQQDNCEQAEPDLSPHRLPRFILPFSFLLLPYLITLSALASTFGGMVRPICLAVLRLMTNSNFFGCSIGRSAGLAPFRILST